MKICFHVFVLTFLIVSCSQTLKVSNENLIVEFNQNMYSRVVAKFGNYTIDLGDLRPSEYVLVDGKKITDFKLLDMDVSDTDNGKKITLAGDAEGLSKVLTIWIDDAFPAMAVYQVKYTNTGTSAVTVASWTNNDFEIKSGSVTSKEAPFWSYQGGSYESRPDWVLPLKQGFEQQNFMGMNATDYGGGTPVSDVWRRDIGLAVGHIELVPKLVSLPVTMPEAGAAMLNVTQAVNKTLEAGESITSLKTFVSVHQGDYYQTLTDYRRYMIIQGIKFDTPPKTAYEPIWCAWGYQRNFTMDQIYNTLPKVKELGFEWAVLDDGFQTAEGDWYLLKDKFPNGDRDMQRLVEKIHSYDLKAKLWWAPLAVDPGTDLIKNHPEYLLLNEDNSKQKISWWKAFYLCPASKDVQEYTKEMVKKIMQDWGYDGLKIDGQHLNGAPPCYNPAHEHAYPEEAFEKVPEFFQVIYETALEINPQAVVEICPCGATFAFHTMPFYNQPVSSDPESSWQIRLKGKTTKALMGPSTPYYGDHVELSDGRTDFASSVGIGAVIGTKFTWPVGAKKNSKIDLTPEKEKIWKKWTDIYLDKMLSKGEYAGTLYDIGFDKPETHVVKKGAAMYYAFYADTWQGEVELRGLQEQEYKLIDYVNDKDLGTITGPVASVKVEFEKHLLLEAKPQ
jgi:alpha-galactosidase